MYITRISSGIGPEGDVILGLLRTRQRCAILVHKRDMTCAIRHFCRPPFDTSERRKNLNFWVYIHKKNYQFANDFKRAIQGENAHER